MVIQVSPNTVSDESSLAVIEVSRIPRLRKRCGRSATYYALHGDFTASYRKPFQLTKLGSKDLFV
jgi:hypothetical protein